jgi:DNA-3-methyladenine glycosylase I
MTTPDLPGDSYCAHAISHPLHEVYHREAYGFPIRAEAELFGRLLLEINQAGLSWLTILKKADSFRQAYSNFEVDKVARYGDDDRERLLADAGIIRNRLKVEAAIHNARRILELRENHGSFANWLDAHHPRPRSEWVRLFRKNFRFTGGEITGEFLMSTGYLPGAHHPACPVHARVLATRPPWAVSAPEGGWSA